MNVVTIDFDIIMEPSISFYNNMVDIEDPMKDYVDKFSFLTNIPADLYIYDYLTRYIVRAAKQNQEIYFVNSHDKVIDILKTIPHDEQIDLYNIDHHHDLGYDMESADWIRPMFKYDLSNWVKYARDKKMVDTFYWVHNENSDPYPNEAVRYVTEDYVLKDFNLEDDKYAPDVLIICSSFEWIPPVYQPLFYSWNTICSEITGKEYPFDSIEKI